MNFKDLLLQAKAGDDKALTGLLMMYRPLLLMCDKEVIEV